MFLISLPSLFHFSPAYFSADMEENSGTALGNCLEPCYEWCFGYSQHDLQTGNSQRDRFVSGCEQCCIRTSTCICCFPCYDVICDRCLKHDLCNKCLHCSCFYSDSEEKVLPDCDTTPGLVRQSSTKSNEKYVSPCAASNFNILEQPMASNTTVDGKASFVNPKSDSGGKMTVRAITHQPPRLSLLISKKNPYQQMHDPTIESLEEKSEEVSDLTEEGEMGGHEEITGGVEVHVTQGDTGEEEINTAKIDPVDLNTNIFVKEFMQTTV